MRHRKLPSQEVLLSILDYDPETGVLTWLPRTTEHFKNPSSVNRWNGAWAGKTALAANRNGYLGGCLMGANHNAHRVIWKMMTGHEADTVDHIDGDRKNNKWSNLRSVTLAENCRNKTLPKNNTSGRIGVVRVKNIGRWVAQARQNGKTYYIGMFARFEDAVAARRNWEQSHGMHKNHGRPNPRLSHGGK